MNMNSKIGLRAESVRLASLVEGTTPDNIIDVAGKVERYVLGSAELPETYDQTALVWSLATLFLFDGHGYECNEDTQGSAQ